MSRSSRASDTLQASGRGPHRGAQNHLESFMFISYTGNTNGLQRRIEVERTKKLGKKPMKPTTQTYRGGTPDRVQTTLEFLCGEFNKIVFFSRFWHFCEISFLYYPRADLSLRVDVKVIAVHCLCSGKMPWCRSGKQCANPVDVGNLFTGCFSCLFSFA